MTLIEVVIGTAILVTVIVVVWNIYVTSIGAVSAARELRVITDDAQDILEKIQSVSFRNIVTEFPGGSVVDGDLIGGFTLTDEFIRVTYPQGESSDPLEVQIEIGWRSYNNREKSEIFKTMRSSI